MAVRVFSLWVLGAPLLVGCSGPPLSQRREAASPAIAALQEGRFDQADERAGQRLSADGANPYARLVRAVVRYKKTMHQLSLDGRTVMGGAMAGGINHKYLRTAGEEAEQGLAGVESDLAVAWAAPDIALDLCVACWEIDWNGNGVVDERDRLLFQIEQDEHGVAIPPDDPRRKPTFRFDHGDVAWARAFVSFQRAALDVLLAYDFAEVDRLLGEGPSHLDREKIVIHLRHPERVDAARRRVLEGLDRSDEALHAYLAETDDEREWVPNPRQRSHPMPLPVDQPLFDTWEATLGDLRRLVRGEDGLAVADMASLDHELSPLHGHGFIDIGSMLSQPGDITLDVSELSRLDRVHDADGILTALLGKHYAPSMRPSPLPRRLARMKGEIDRDEEKLERKLRYLFWLN
jgi:hypothetical protein